jgi:hypothetical protein
MKERSIWKSYIRLLQRKLIEQWIVKVLMQTKKKFAHGAAEPNAALGESMFITQQQGDALCWRNELFPALTLKMAGW